MKNYLEISLLAIVAMETSFLTYRNIRQISRRSRFDHPIFVDTSVLMDGRIVSVAKTGFITGELVIPRSVILELQLLADKSDHDKRERARFGLDVVAQLQASEMVRVRLHHDAKATNGVDERLLELARHSSGLVLTLDYNLQKVAATEGIKVLNLNELAQTLRIERLPGERLSLELVEKGSDSHQAVGYLNDGTMVVVEHASNRIGKTETIEIIRSLQTAAGRMCFARLVTNDSSSSQGKSAVTLKQSVVKKNTKGRKPTQKTEKFETDDTKKTRSVKAESRPTESTPKLPSNSQSRRSRPKTSKQHESSLLRSIENQIETD